MQSSQPLIAILSGISIILYILPLAMFYSPYDFPDMQMVANILMIVTSATMVSAFALSIKKGSYVAGTALAAIGIFQVYRGYLVVTFQNPAAFLSGEFVQNSIIGIFIGAGIIGMAALAIFRKIRASSVNSVEKKSSAPNP
jgi:hypothetical protein